MENLKRIQPIFEQQTDPKNIQLLRNSSAKERINKIKSIQNYILDEANHQLIASALYKDLRKPNEEVITTEITPIVLTIKEVVKNLKQWMRDEHVPSPITMVGMSSYIKYESKGNILIISPWNYPFQLTIYPLIYAVASGNAVIIKPSEIASETSKVIYNMLQKLFSENEVAVIEGGQEASTELLKLPFNHIHFTGSPRVGKIVMEAAAKNLSGITLELGGKSPVIIDGTTNIKKTAQKVAWAKAMNCGQTCIAPDFALVQKEHLSTFNNEFILALKKFYNPENNGIEKANEYGRIVNENNFERVKSLLDDAIEKGAKLVFGGNLKKEEKYIEPTLLTNISLDMKVMQEEIFGPILPVMTFEKTSEVVDLLQKMPSPLALYIMSKKQKTIDYLLNNTVSGGVGIDELMLNSVNPSLPFGGVNNSGLGKTGGKHSFMDFSNQRGIIKHNMGNSLKLIYPPFNKNIFKIFKKIIRL
jgi:aldehyde dehydrogenase (NAD+)